MSQPMDEQEQRKLEQLLARTPVIQAACYLDLIVFLYRHPRALLTTEQLAGFIGYNLKDTVKSLDALIAAGLLDRTKQPSTHAARMFVLLLAGPQGDAVRDLLEIASTREGRRRVLEAFQRRGPRQTRPGTNPDLRLVKSA